MLFTNSIIGRVSRLILPGTVINGKLLLEGDAQSATDHVLLEGDAQSGSDILLYTETL